jgi:SH3-like domain-containing protein
MVSLCLGFAVATAVQADSGAAAIKVNAAVPGATSYVAKGDNINVRSRPATNAEIVAQLKKGAPVEVLETKKVGEGAAAREWARINLPATAKCYVNSLLLKDGAATTDAVNVRSGPGMNFKDIGKLDKGQQVEVVKVEGEWTRIKPTAQCFGWVAADLLDAVAPVPVAPPVITSEVVPPPAALPPPPIIETRTVEVEVEVQVQYVVKDGIFRKVDGAEKTPTAYELLTQDVERRQYRIAFLDVKDSGLERFQGKHVRVLGNERWRKGERYPVIVVERLEQVW